MCEALGVERFTELEEFLGDATAPVGRKPVEVARQFLGGAGGGGQIALAERTGEIGRVVRLARRRHGTGEDFPERLGGSVFTPRGGFETFGESLKLSGRLGAGLVGAGEPRGKLTLDLLNGLKFRRG